MRKDDKTHRADIVTRSGRVIELQATFLDAQSIAAREDFYDNMVWLYRADRWAGRIHFGARGFWWKRGAKALTTHRRPVYWHVGREVWQVALSLVEHGHGGLYNVNGELFYSQVTERVLGRLIRKLTEEQFLGVLNA